MPATRVIKQKPVKTSGTESELRAPAVRKTRASSGPRCPQRRGRAEKEPCGAPSSCCAPRTTCERRARSTCTAQRPADTCAKAGTSSVKHVDPKCREVSARGVRAEAKSASHSHKAFTVIPPNPKKRREIQRKAEAELAALEELRLSRAMAYVSINPSSVGGCMSLEEVRSKQQQEMMQAKRKQIKKQVMEETPVLTS